MFQLEYTRMFDPDFLKKTCSFFFTFDLAGGAGTPDRAILAVYQWVTNEVVTWVTADDGVGVIRCATGAD